MRSATILTLMLILAGLSLTALAQPETAVKPSAGKRAGAAQEQNLKDQPLTTATGTMKNIAQPDEAKSLPMMTFDLIQGDKPVTKVAVAPPPVLTRLGLTLKEDAPVTVVGWPVTRKDQTVLLVRDLTLDGKVYSIRDAKGQLPGGEFAGLPQVTLVGTVTEFVQPVANVQPTPPAGDAKVDNDGKKVRGKGTQQVHFTLKTATDAILVLLGPAQLLEKLGFTLKDGDKISVTGWKREAGKRSGVVAKEIILDGKTIVLRDEAGRPARNGDHPAKERTRKERANKQ